jgi:hypothetical protein
MIAPRTTALIVAMALVGAAPTAINAFADNVQVVNQEDNDDVKQKNKAKIDQESGQANIQGIGVLSPQTNANTQTGVIAQSNTNNDNDAQIAVASIDDRDACGILIAFGIDC